MPPVGNQLDRYISVHNQIDNINYKITGYIIRLSTRSLVDLSQSIFTKALKKYNYVLKKLKKKKLTDHRKRNNNK